MMINQSEKRLQILLIIQYHLLSIDKLMIILHNDNLLLVKVKLLFMLMQI